MRRRGAACLPALVLVFWLPACSGSYPPDERIIADVRRMVEADREIGFDTEALGIEVTAKSRMGKKVEVEVMVDGYAVHPELRLGATLPVSTSRRPGWARWKYYLVPGDGVWTIEERYKVEEGFL